MTRTFGEHGLEAKVIDILSDAVGVDEFRVAESLRSDTEILLDRRLVLEDLMFELLPGRQRSERMVLGLAEELHAAGISKRLETLGNLRSVTLELLERGT